MDAGAALEEHREHAECGQPAEGRFQRPVRPFDARACTFQRAHLLPPGFRLCRVAENVNRAGIERPEYPRGGWRAQSPVEDGPDEGPRAIHVADRQSRVIHQQRPDADGDGIHFGAQLLHLPQRRRRADRGRLPGRCSDVPVDAHRGLRDHERPALLNRGEERRVQLPRAPGFDANGHRDSVRLEISKPSASDPRVRILDGSNHLFDARGNDAFDARSRATVVRAWLERADQPGAACAAAGLVEGVHFGVRRAGLLVIPVADDGAIRQHDARTDHRVGTGLPAATLGQPQRAPHQGVYHFSSKSAVT